MSAAINFSVTGSTVSASYIVFSATFTIGAGIALVTFACVTDLSTVIITISLGITNTGGGIYYIAGSAGIAQFTGIPLFTYAGITLLCTMNASFIRITNSGSIIFVIALRAIFTGRARISGFANTLISVLFTG